MAQSQNSTFLNVHTWKQTTICSFRANPNPGDLNDSNPEIVQETVIVHLIPGSQAKLGISSDGRVFTHTTRIHTFPQYSLPAEVPWSEVRRDGLLGLDRDLSYRMGYYSHSMAHIRRTWATGATHKEGSISHHLRDAQVLKNTGAQQAALTMLLDAISERVGRMLHAVLVMRQQNQEAPATQIMLTELRDLSMILAQFRPYAVIAQHVEQDALLMGNQGLFRKHRAQIQYAAEQSLRLALMLRELSALRARVNAWLRYDLDLGFHWDACVSLIELFRPIVNSLSDCGFEHHQDRPAIQFRTKLLAALDTAIASLRAPTVEYEALNKALHDTIGIISGDRPNP